MRGRSARPRTMFLVGGGIGSYMLCPWIIAFATERLRLLDAAMACPWRRSLQESWRSVEEINFGTIRMNSTCTPDCVAHGYLENVDVINAPDACAAHLTWPHPSHISYFTSFSTPYYPSVVLSFITRFGMLENRK